MEDNREITKSDVARAVDHKNNKVKNWITKNKWIVLIAIVILIGIIWWFWKKSKKSTDVNVSGAKIDVVVPNTSSGPIAQITKKIFTD